MKNFVDGFNPNDYAIFTDISGDGQALVLQHKITQHLVVKKIISTKNLNLYSQLIHLRHKNLVQILGVETLENDEQIPSFYTYEEFVQGKTLEETIANKPILQETAVNWILQICTAVDVLHSQNPPIIHRDIKPSNIIISDGTVKLLDFNAAKDVKPNQLRDTTLMGTPGYAAPEQYGYSASDPRTDIYAIGVIFAEMLTGFREISQFDKLDKLDKKGNFNHYKKIIQNCTQLDPKRRYKSIKELERQISKNNRTKIFASVVGFAAVAILAILVNNFVIQNQPENIILAEEPTLTEENIPVTMDFAEVMTVSTQAEFLAAVAAIPPNGTTTIALANSIDIINAQLIVENGENITLDLTNGDLNVILNPGGGTSVWVDSSTISIIGDGEFNILNEGRNFSMLEARNAELTISNILGGLMINILTTNLTVHGNLDFDVLQTSQSNINVAGNLTGELLANSTNNIEINGNVGQNINLFWAENRIKIGGDVGGNIIFDKTPQEFTIPQNFPTTTDELTINGNLHGEIIFIDLDRTEIIRQPTDYDEIVTIDGQQFLEFSQNNLRGDFQTLWLAE
ncbi:MAG: serine/threonine protein kinase [Firmicutes bacterium]|nr:serine/threonine protein kinase [Bacillota bacterium]